jgi:hypothetical protein
MDDNKKFVDPLDDLIARHQAAANNIGNTGTAGTTDNTNAATTGDVNIVNPASEKVSVDIPIDTPITTNVATSATAAVPATSNDEDEYGVNDLAAEMAAEDAAREAARREAFEERQKNADTQNKKVLMPPDEHDPEHHKEAIGFQTDKLAIVTTMVNKVVAKYHLFTGGIPDMDQKGRPIKMHLIGELIDQYHKDGEVITPEFESLILNNWIMDDGSTAMSYIKNPKKETDNTGEDTTTTTTTESDTDKAPESIDEALKNDAPTINITVENGTPVTVNVDESIVAETTRSREINVHVREVSEYDLHASTIIENSQQEGIIGVYDSGSHDVPITLPLSGYRCVMRPINWFDFIQLTAPTSQNQSDNELKKWSVIYKHMKNPSIGDFENFEDFLKKTKYQDREILMWAILVATADEEEHIDLKCQNKKCGRSIPVTYYPREIIHLDSEHIPSYYTKTHDVAVGEEALRHWKDINCRRKRYKLPNTGIIAEINDPTAYEFITKKLPLVQKLYERYRSEGSLADLDTNDPTLAEFDYISAHALLISAMTIVKDNKEYRYTNWDDIEKIITESLDTADSGILLKVIQQSRTNVSPASFYLSDIECPACHRLEKKVVISDIANTLLFQISRRLENTQVNLIEME